MTVLPIAYRLCLCWGLSLLRLYRFYELALVRDATASQDRSLMIACPQTSSSQPSLPLPLLRPAASTWMPLARR